MATCYQCGTELPNGAEFCPYCGMAIVPTAPAAAGVAAGGAGAAPIPGTAHPITGVAPGPQLITPTLPGGGGAALPRLGRRALLILGVVAAVLTAGGIGYAVFRPAGPSGPATVQRYFDDLAKGDTTGALKLVADVEQLTGAEYPLLSAEALADRANRPTNLRVLGTETVSRSGRSLTQIRVSYQVGGATVNQAIVAYQPAEGEDFLLTNPFVRLSVEGAAGRPVTVNGVAISGDDLDTYAFPGRYTGTAQGSALLTGDTEKATMQMDPSGQPYAGIAFGEPQLAPGAQDVIQQKVRALIDDCARSTSPTPINCPFRAWAYGRDASLTWKITAYPALTIQISKFASSGSQVVIDGTGGVAHYDATYTDFFGNRQTESGDQDFSIDGAASARGSTITLSIR